MTTSTFPSSSADPELADRLAAVRERVAEAARSAGREPEDLTTIVVTKFHPASLVRALLDLGATEFGENRHQEARDKAAELDGTAARWHFVGQLQGKKARQVRAYADVVHSIDRPSLVDALADPAHPLDVFVQVNLTDDPGRGGVAPAELEALVEHADAAPGLRLLGLMAVAPLDEEPARAFARLRGLADRARSIAPEARFLSAGMSADLEQAVAEGATHLRIGTAITGSRPVAG